MKHGRNKVSQAQCLFHFLGLSKLVLHVNTILAENEICEDGPVIQFLSVACYFICYYCQPNDDMHQISQDFIVWK